MSHLQTDNLEDQFEREDRFTSIEPGQYWEVKEEFTIGDFHKRYLRAGTALLVLDVDLVDGIPHTININFHPSWGKGYFSLRIQDFVRYFTPCLNPEEVRNREILAIQSEVAKQQQKLNEAMADPTLLQDEISEKLIEWEKNNKPESSSSTALVAQGDVSMTPGTLISSKATSRDVDAMVYQAKRQAEIIFLHSGAIQRRASEISSLVNSITPYMTEKADAMVARSKNAMKRVQGIMNGVRSLTLYVGEGVEVHQIVDGDSAPREEKPRIMQQKLFMNEELAVFADVSERFDYVSIEKFDKELSNPEFLKQILPHPRCVVSMAVRRDSVNYGDPFVSTYKNAINKSVFLLIRDGGKVYRVHSSEPSHENAPRLFPTRHEIDSIFKSWGEEITFESLQYTKALKKHEINALHYKRFMILLCGLDHRLKLLGDFYPDSETMNFMTPEFQSTYFDFVRDDDPDYVIENEKMDVMKWIGENNKLVQSGSRIAFIPSKLLDTDNAPSCFRVSYDRGSARDHVDRLATPTREFEITTVARQGDELVTFTEVKRESWRDDLSRPIFNARIKIDPTKRNYLCLDDVRSEDLDYYVNNRRSRIESCSYIQLFKIVSAHLKNEENLQAETEDYLFKSAQDAGITDSRAVVRTAIRQWRCVKKGELLPNKDNLSQLTPILDQIHALSAGSDDIVSRVRSFVEEQGLEAIRLTVTGRNHLVLYADTPEHERTRMIDHHWIDRHVLRMGKTKVGIASTSRFWNTGQNQNKEKILHEWKDMVVNNHRAPCSMDDLKDYERCIQEGYSFLSKGAPLDPDVFNQIMNEVNAIQSENKSGYVIYPMVRVPFASFISKGDLAFVYIQSNYKDFIRYFGTDEQIEAVRKQFVGQFKNKDAGNSRFDEPINIDMATSFPRKLSLYVSKPNLDYSHNIGDAKLLKKSGVRITASGYDKNEEADFEGDNEVQKLFSMLKRRVQDNEFDVRKMQFFCPKELIDVSSIEHPSTEVDSPDLESGIKMFGRKF